MVLSADNGPAQSVAEGMGIIAARASQTTTPTSCLGFASEIATRDQRKHPVSQRRPTRGGHPKVDGQR